MNLDSPQTRYAMLRTSLEMFRQPPADLDEGQSLKLQQQVNSQLAIGMRLLEGDAASQVVVPDETVDQACRTLEAEYGSREDFDETLAYNGLDRHSLREALHYELKVEATLEQLFSAAAAISDEEVEIYYLQHKERFTLPETRTVSHILITINDDYVENSREQAYKRISELHKECAGSGETLKSLAARHSECPSGMNQGVIGRVRPGQLYTTLDQALFAMREGELSDTVESEVGWHLLYCEKVYAAKTLEMEQVREKIRERLEKKLRTAILKDYLSPSGP